MLTPYLIWIKLAGAALLLALAGYGGWHLKALQDDSAALEEKRKADAALVKENDDLKSKATDYENNMATFRTTIAKLQRGRKTDSQRIADLAEAAKLGVVGGACMPADRLLDLSRAVAAANTASGSVSAVPAAAVTR